MAVVKRFASSENNQERLRDQQGKFIPSKEYLSSKVESQLKSDKVVSWINEGGNIYIRREKEKLDVSTLFLFASILLIVIFK